MFFYAAPLLSADRIILVILSATNDFILFFRHIGRMFKRDGSSITLLASNPDLSFTKILSYSVPGQIFMCSVVSFVLQYAH